MCEDRAVLPQPALEGGAGTGNPTDREIRYSGYTEKMYELRNGHEEETYRGTDKIQ